MATRRQHQNQHAQKTYVVFKGRNPGIYNTWEECWDQVCGFSGQLYRGYPTRHDAETAWIRYWSRISAQTEAQNAALQHAVHADTRAGMIADNAIPLLANEEHNELDHAPATSVPHSGGVSVGNIVIVAILVLAIFMWFVVAKIF